MNGKPFKIGKDLWDFLRQMSLLREHIQNTEVDVQDLYNLYSSNVALSSTEIRIKSTRRANNGDISYWNGKAQEFRWYTKPSKLHTRTSAARQFSVDHWCRSLWIDALCIDQANTMEETIRYSRCAGYTLMRKEFWDGSATMMA